MKTFFVALKTFLKKYIDDLLDLFLDDKSSAALQDFIMNNFSIAFLINAVGLLIIWFIITRFYISIKNDILPISFTKKVSASSYMWSVIGITILQVVTLTVMLFSLLEVSELASENPPPTEAFLILSYFLEWIVLSVTLIVFLIFGGIWTAARFRDLGQSGWKVLLTLIPVANLYFIVRLISQKGVSFIEETAQSRETQATTPEEIEETAIIVSLFKAVPMFQKIMLAVTLLFIIGMGALEYNIVQNRFYAGDNINFSQRQEEQFQSSGIFIGTTNRNDFYLLPETFSGDKKSFKVTVEYIDKDANQKGELVFFFVRNPVGWIYYDSINESEKNYVSKLHDGDVIKNIWDYCMEVKLEDSLPITTQSESPKKKPMYRYPGQHNNGIYVWAGYMRGYGCYLDTNSVHVFDNTSEYKDWEQVVRLYDEDKFVESIIQKFHWDPQNGACVGGRGISRITDKNLMYQFETGWRHAFGTEYR